MFFFCLRKEESVKENEMKKIFWKKQINLFINWLDLCCFFLPFMFIYFCWSLHFYFTSTATTSVELNELKTCGPLVHLTTNIMNHHLLSFHVDMLNNKITNRLISSTANIYHNNFFFYYHILCHRSFFVSICRALLNLIIAYWPTIKIT